MIGSAQHLNSVKICIVLVHLLDKLLEKAMINHTYNFTLNCPKLTKAQSNLNEI